jgi:hypothetical protein
MADSYDNDITLGSDWVNVAQIYPAMASVSGWVQNAGTSKIRVAFRASATKPIAGGNLLSPGDIAYGTAANCFVKAVGNAGLCTVGLTD